MKKTDNVFLKLRDSRGTHKVACGYLSPKALDELCVAIDEHHRPYHGCTFVRGYEIRQNEIVIKKLRTKTTQTSQKLTINLERPDLATLCYAKSGADCLNCLAHGECKYLELINLIGKKLFADKYTNEK
ncbi:MAG: hypothetical protein J5608_00635 [Alphaproteobacteria bacterium]|nr:hypothetical protein [Alphaproteobacteria bacterium]